MQPVWEWGIAVIEWLQPTAETAGVAASWLDALFVGISSLGAGETYLLLIPLVIWCVSYRLGVGLLLLFLVSSELNLVLKEILQHPRPFELVPELQRVATHGYGLPSGHAQNSVVVWGGLALAASCWRDTRSGSSRAQQHGLSWMLASMVPLIGLSRVYLGVHFPTDVLLGWMIGGGLMVAAVTLWTRSGRSDSFGVIPRLAAGVVGVAALIPQQVESAFLLGLLAGALAGAVWKTRRTWSRSGADLHLSDRQRGLRFMVGVSVPLTIYLLSRVGLASTGSPLAGGGGMQPAAAAAIAALLGSWITLGAPRVFIALSLCPEDRSAPEGSND